MKKAFGIIFLLLGLGMIALGIAAITNVETRRSSVEGYFGSEFSDSYRRHNTEQQIVGTGLTVGGLIFFILGIVMVATKSSSQRKKEAELNSIKKWSEHNHQTDHSTDANTDNMTRQAISLYNQKDYYSAIVILQRVLVLSPTSYQTYYNLASLYSITQNPEAFNALSKAVEYGYLNFEKIKTHPDFEWMRKQAEYEGFVKQGYKLKIKATETQPHATPKTSVINNDIYVQLEKLSDLKQRGIITEVEFAEQKKKLLAAI
ncbi:MAG: hypothetical protein JWO44_2566 [Bacteroidetes bacterium]|nr:hypothetical protein [Bacteroidota bacterium]